MLLHKELKNGKLIGSMYLEVLKLPQRRHQLLGGIAQRFGQPSVLGELVAGVILGASVLGVLDPNDPAIAAALAMLVAPAMASGLGCWVVQRR